MSRTAGRRAFDLLESGLVPLMPLAPRLALGGAAGLGALRNRISRRWPAPEEVRQLFPGLDPATAARVAWKIGGLEARNRVLASCLRRAGLSPLRPLVRNPTALAALRPPLLLGTFHAGTMHALLPALERLPGPVLALRQGLLAKPRPPVEVVSTEGDDQRRAAVFQRALAHLGAGGFVVLALDVAPGPALRVPCLGRTLELARGPFALARLAGVPLLPLVARWQQGGVEIVTGEALAPSPGPSPAERERGDASTNPGREGAPSPAPRGRDGEGALATAAAGWLERYLLKAPTELGLGLLRALLTPPQVDR